MDRGAWRATAHGVAKESDTTEAAEHTQYSTALQVLNKHLLKG